MLLDLTKKFPSNLGAGWFAGTRWQFQVQQNVGAGVKVQVFARFTL
jgi:hypothetical protein